MVLFLAVASNVFGAVFAWLGTATWITNMLLAAPLPAWGTMTLLLAVIFLLGWPFEWPAIVLIFLPLLAPVAKGLGYDMVWFGCIVAVVLQTAFLSPPVAMSAYYLKQVVKEWNLRLIYRGMADFMVIQVRLRRAGARLPADRYVVPELARRAAQGATRGTAASAAHANQAAGSCEHQNRALAAGPEYRIMSAIGTKRTSLVAPHMSAFGGKADMTLHCTCPLMTQSGHLLTLHPCSINR